MVDENVLRDSHLLEAGLHQILREKISDEIKESIHTGHLVILLSLSKISPQLGVPWMDEQHQDHSQDSCNHCCWHVVHHGSGA